MCKIYILANLILLLGVDKVFYNAGHTEGLFLSGTNDFTGLELSNNM